MFFSRRPKGLPPEEEERRRRELEQIDLDWRDRLAMLLSAFGVLLLPSLLLLLLLCLLSLALFGLL